MKDKMFSLVLYGASGFCTIKPLFKWCSLISAHLFIKPDAVMKANSGHCGVVMGFSALTNGGNTGWAHPVPVCFARKSPRIPPEEGLLHPLQSHLLLTGDIKQRQRGKVIFFFQLSIFWWVSSAFSCVLS